MHREGKEKGWQWVGHSDLARQAAEQEEMK